MQIFKLRWSDKKQNIVHIHIPTKSLTLEEVLFSGPFEKDPQKNFNIFYTAGNPRLPLQKRDYDYQEIIPIDIDKIDYTKKQEYWDAVEETIQIDQNECGLVSSGRGIQFIIPVAERIKKESIASLRPAYTQMIKEIGANLTNRGLPFSKMDSSVWSPARFLRVPNTINRRPIRKADKYEMFHATVEETDIIPQEFNWAYWKDQAEKNRPKKTYSSSGNHAKYNPEYVMKNCGFLAKQLKEGGKNASEPEWYAALGVTSHFNDPKYSHLVSNKHSDYAPEQTDRKAEQAAQKPPRSCESISEFYDCSKCPKWGKIKTPVILSPWECPTELKDYPDDDILSDDPNTETKEENKEESKEESKEKGQAPQQDQRGGEAKKSREPDLSRWDEYIENGFSTLHENKKSGKVTVERNPNLLRQYFKDKYNYITDQETGDIWCYQDGKYVKWPEQKVKAFAQKMYAPTCQKEAERKEFLNTCKVHHLKDTEWLGSKNRGRFNLKNGTFNFKTGELEEHSPENAFTYKLDYEYKEDAKAETWEKLLNIVFQNNKNLINTFEEFIGYTLSGDPYTYNKALMLLGGGRNGKSTLVNVVRQLVGEDNTSFIKIATMSRFDAGQMKNMLCNISEEEPVNCFNESSQFKQLTGNSGIYADIKYGPKGYKFISYAKQILTLNSAPNLKDISDGMQSRMLLLPLNHNFDENPETKIKDVEDILGSELPGIFKRCYKAYKRLKERGKFLDLQETKDIMDQIVKESDPFTEFTSDYIEFTQDKNDKCVSKELWNIFDMDFPKHNMTERQFYHRLKSRCKKEKVFNGLIKIQGKPMKGVKGVRILIKNHQIIATKAKPDDNNPAVIQAKKVFRNNFDERKT